MIELGCLERGRTILGLGDGSGLWGWVLACGGQNQEDEFTFKSGFLKPDFCTVLCEQTCSD